MGARMVNRVLMIAYHYPPMRGSSGIQRTLKFSQYLPGVGWEPVVLSAHPRAYANSGPDQLGDIPAGTVVKRAFALDTSRHLAWRGRYLGALALPDRWVSWLLGAVPAGLGLIRRHKPAVIWSTYPIATAHLVGLTLHRLTGIPWVIDLRDPMTDEGYPEDPRTRRTYLWIEKLALRHCTRAVCTTPGAIATYRRRFPELPAERFSLIENGYDEENFADAEQAASNATSNSRFTLVHSGVIYPSERDPRPLFAAVAELAAQGVIAPANFELVLRATGHDGYLAGLIAELGIAALVTLAPHVSYREALTEMVTAGGLLILQASNCNHQVPAKLYEYLRAGRPVLALTDPVGDTAATLRKAGIDTIAPLDDKDAIVTALQRFLALAKAGSAPLASQAAVAANSRRARAGQLGALLDNIVAAGGIAARTPNPISRRDAND